MKIYGKVKSLDRGVMIMSTDFSDSDFKIKWNEVERLYLHTHRRIFSKYGERFIGRIIDAQDSLDHAYIITVNDSIILAYADIVHIDEIKDKFKDKLKMGINLGYGYTKANRSQHFSLRTNFGYFAENWDLSGSINAFATSIDTLVTSRNDLSLSFKWFLLKDWYTTAIIQTYSSDQQQLDLRITSLLGFGNYFIQNTQMIFFMSVGAAYNREDYADISENNLLYTSYEAFATLDYTLFGNSDIDLTSSIMVLPSLTDKNRVRASYSIDMKWDIVKHFNFKLGYSLNFDNKPPNNGRKNDYVINLTFGWKL